MLLGVAVAQDVDPLHVALLLRLLLPTVLHCYAEVTVSRLSLAFDTPGVKRVRSSFVSPQKKILFS